MKHSYLTMWLPHPSTPDYVYHEQEKRDRRDQLQRDVEATGNRAGYYKHLTLPTIYSG